MDPVENEKIWADSQQDYLVSLKKIKADTETDAQIW
jgi:hypothetical protein